MANWSAITGEPIIANELGVLRSMDAAYIDAVYSQIEKRTRQSSGSHEIADGVLDEATFDAWFG